MVFQHVDMPHLCLDAYRLVGTGIGFRVGSLGEVCDSEAPLAGLPLGEEEAAGLAAWAFRFPAI